MSNVNITPRLSIIVPCRNEEQAIGATLRALLAQVDDEGVPVSQWAEIIIVDDESEDFTPSIVKEFAANTPCIQIVRNEPRRGLAGSYNRAIRQARADTVLVCHADCRMITPAYAQRILACFSDPTIGAATGKPIVPNVRSLRFAEKVYLASHLMEVVDELPIVREINFAEGRCDGFRKQALIQAGLYDEKTGIAGEDQIISNRLRELGLRVVQDTSIKYEISSGSSQSTICRIIRRHTVLARGQAYVFLNSGWNTSKMAELSPNRGLRKRLRVIQLIGVPTIGLLALVAVLVKSSVIAYIALGLLALRISWMCVIITPYFRMSELPLFVPIGLACDGAYAWGFFCTMLTTRKGGSNG